MKRLVQWSRAALDDVLSQVAHIAAENPHAARRVAERIDAAGRALGEMATGRTGRVAGTYEKVVARLPYVIAYAIAAQADNEIITILRVIHTSRHWPGGEWPQ